MTDLIKPIVALTMGDPAGVGPELALRALAEPSLQSLCQLLVFGDTHILQRCADELLAKRGGAAAIPTQADLRAIPSLALDAFLRQASAADNSSSGHRIIQVDSPGVRELQPAVVSPAAGRAAFAYIQAALAASDAGVIDAVTTNPINKEALRAAGIEFPGHTEMFAEHAGAKRWCMMQYSAEITCTFVTVHVGYAQVPALITRQSVLDTIELTAAALRRILGREPKLVVCGLNPHAGEHGLFGNREEEHQIIPAIEAARAAGLQVEGPLPPDTVFLPAKRRMTDGVVCMYHDQGHIPLKALAFDSAVNTTLGLRLIRTSVDHGTAFDIAWRGVADCGSLFAAIRLAVKLHRLDP